MKLSIYRYDPDKDEKPYMKDYVVELDSHDRMLLDALVKLKAQDDSIAFRRSRWSPGIARGLIRPPPHRRRRPGRGAAWAGGTCGTSSGSRTSSSGNRGG